MRTLIEEKAVEIVNKLPKLDNVTFDPMMILVIVEAIVMILKAVKECRESQQDVDMIKMAKGRGVLARIHVRRALRKAMADEEMERFFLAPAVREMFAVGESLNQDQVGEMMASV